MKQKIETGYSVPENYFSELTEKLEAAVALERLKGLTNEDGFDVPAGYFGQLQTLIIEQTSGVAQPSKIVKLWRSNLLKYATAACFIIIAGVGLYFNTNTSVRATQYADLSTDQMLFEIDEDVIIEHIEASALQENQMTKNEVALENYILTNYSSNELTNDY